MKLKSLFCIILTLILLLSVMSGCGLTEKATQAIVDEVVTSKKGNNKNEAAEGNENKVQEEVKSDRSDQSSQPDTEGEIIEDSDSALSTEITKTVFLMTSQTASWTVNGSSSSTTYTYDYDNDGRLIHYGEQLVQDGSITTVSYIDYAYDTDDRLCEVVTSKKDVPSSEENIYTFIPCYENGLLVGYTSEDWDGGVIKFTYNNHGWLQSASIDNEDSAYTLLDITYHDNGIPNVVSQDSTLSAVFGHRFEWTYDNKGYLTEQKAYLYDTLQYRYAYTYDRQGHVTSTTHYDYESEKYNIVVHEYDDAGHLAAMGGWDGEIIPSEVTPSNYGHWDETQNQMTFEQGASTIVLTYDTAGNLLQQTTSSSADNYQFEVSYTYTRIEVPEDYIERYDDPRSLLNDPRYLINIF